MLQILSEVSLLWSHYINNVHVCIPSASCLLPSLYYSQSSVFFTGFLPYYVISPFNARAMFLLLISCTTSTLIQSRHSINIYWIYKLERRELLLASIISKAAWWRRWDLKGILKKEQDLVGQKEAESIWDWGWRKSDMLIGMKLLKHVKYT